MNTCRTCKKVYQQALHDAETPEKRAVRLERHRQRTFRWKLENKVHIREYTAKTRSQNTERHKRWRYANPDRWAAIVRNNDVLRRGYKKGGITAPEMRAWWNAQKKVCHWCGERCPNDAEADHITALSRGGAHVIRNLCVACSNCNRRKAARDPIEWAQMIGKLL